MALWFKENINLNLKTILLIIFALLLSFLISSANYIINQITDRDFDAKHIIKKNRPIPAGRISLIRAWIITILLSISSLSFASIFFERWFSLTLLGLLIAGLLYNIKPARLKNIPYIDVLAESANNPIRFLLGWFIILPLQFPPIILLFLTWSGGAVLMTAKRYDELLFYGKKLVPYRNTFQHYSKESLKLLLYFYSILTIIFYIFFSLSFQPKLLLAIPFVLLFNLWIIKVVLNGLAKTRSVESFVLTPKFIFLILILLSIMGILLFSK